MKQSLKIIISSLLLILIASPLSSQRPSHRVSVFNIEVPLRVFRGDKFIDNLTKDDFELYDNGIKQKIEALYLIRKTTIDKQEGSTAFHPRVARHFVLFFEVHEYLPKLAEAVKFFFEKVFQPGDSLIVITPLKTYRIKPTASHRLSPEKLASQLINHLKKDIKIGSSEYRTILRDLEESLRGGIDETTLPLFKQHLQKLEDLRQVDEDSLLRFAEFLKKKEGQKYVFLFYQKERIPQITPQQLNQLTSVNQDKPNIIFQIMELFEFYRREIAFNINRVKQHYADSSISIHFLFLTKVPSPDLEVTTMRPSGLVMNEQSEDIFSAFREIAQATGGLVTSSANASAAFQQVIKAAENYYLLYYTPNNYKPDGSFHRLKVKVKKPHLRVIHRAGYFAD
ncbi:MAG: hypothetical protein DRI99_07060 [Candidatus Aminicenantes bacterium]|nr:MAG: hypothetical protein DRI99_07060 [Candidatus Aminicenantes bacterium]RLE04716.1 MAG: hypothetical protein DRJ11_00145 [Candidatus Aminicenantes bacterium]